MIESECAQRTEIAALLRHASSRFATYLLLAALRLVEYEPANEERQAAHHVPVIPVVNLASTKVGSRCSNSTA
jgi:hypothetical protein